MPVAQFIGEKFLLFAFIFCDNLISINQAPFLVCLNKYNIALSGFGEKTKIFELIKKYFPNRKILKRWGNIKKAEGFTGFQAVWYINTCKRELIRKEKVWESHGETSRH